MIDSFLNVGFGVNAVGALDWGRRLGCLLGGLLGLAVGAPDCGRSLGCLLGCRDGESVWGRLVGGGVMIGSFLKVGFGVNWLVGSGVSVTSSEF